MDFETLIYIAFYYRYIRHAKGRHVGKRSEFSRPFHISGREYRVNCPEVAEKGKRCIWEREERRPA